MSALLHRATINRQMCASEVKRRRTATNRYKQVNVQVKMKLKVKERFKQLLLYFRATGSDSCMQSCWTVCQKKTGSGEVSYISCHQADYQRNWVRSHQMHVISLGQSGRVFKIAPLSSHHSTGNQNEYSANSKAQHMLHHCIDG